MDAKDGDLREWRRVRAVQLRHRRWSWREVAEVLDVTERSVSNWTAIGGQRGRRALRSAPIPGRPAALSEAQRRLIPDLLWHGAEAYGFRGAVWTCGRIAKVIEEVFGVAHDPFDVAQGEGHVSRLLRQLGWTPQAPVRRASQRDEQAIERRWRREAWPRLLAEARAQRRTLVFADESGFSLLPSAVRTTHAPVGRTPVLPARLTRDQP